MTRRTILQLALLAAAFVATMAAGAVLEIGGARPDKTASAAELAEFRAVIDEFLGAVAARRGAAAAALVGDDVLALYARSRDLALHAPLEEIDRHRGDADVPLIFALRVLFTADQLEKMTPPDLVAALIERGQLMAPDAAAAWQRAPLVRAEIDRGTATRAHVADAQGRALVLVRQANGGWRLDRAALALLSWDAWSRLPPACIAGTAACAAEQRQRAADYEHWRNDPNPAEIGSRPWLEQAYGALYFATFVHHPFDPRYFNPLRQAAAAPQERRCVLRQAQDEANRCIASANAGKKNASS